MSYKALDLPDQVRGDTWKFSFLIKDTNNAAIDITGLQYWFTVKEKLNDTNDANAAIQVGPFIADPVDALSGKLDLIVSPAQTEGLKTQTYYYDLQEVDATSNVSTLLLGRVKVVKDVTITANYSGTVINAVSASGVAVYIGTTETTSETEIFIEGIQNRRLDIPEDGTLAFDALITGKDTVSLESCAFQINGALENDTGVVRAIGNPGKFVLGKDNPAFDANIVADDTNDALSLRVTPVSTNLTEWRARINYVEIS